MTVGSGMRYLCDSRVKSVLINQKNPLGALGCPLCDRNGKGPKAASWAVHKDFLGPRRTGVPLKLACRSRLNVTTTSLLLFKGASFDNNLSLSLPLCGSAN